MWIKNKISDKELIEAALDARKNAYAPYSKYAVGAALVTPEGKVFKGCNIENASYGGTNCAERTAIFKAVSEGVHSFSAIAIVGGRINEAPVDYAYPCGICRQVMREFVNPKDFRVIIAKNVDEYEEYTLEELLPNSFGPANLEGSEI